MQDHTAMVGNLLKGLLKTVKIIAIYPETNPIPVSARQSFECELVDAVRQFGTIELLVEKDRLLCGDQEVYVDHGKEESLAGLLHRNGLSSLTLGEGLSRAEVGSLLNVFRDYLHRANLGADLVNLIWEANLPSVKYETVENVDLLEFDETFDIEAYLNSNPDELPKYQRYTDPETREYSTLFTDGEVVERATLDENGNQVERDCSDLGLDTDWHGGAPDAAMILNAEFELTDREEDVINELLDADARFDMHESTVALVMELMSQNDELAEYSESLAIAEKIHGQCVGDGRLDLAAELLNHVAEEQQRLEKPKPLWANALSRTIASLSGRDSMRGLALALNHHSILPGSMLEPYLEKFTWEALAGLTGLLGDLEHKDHRLCLRDFLAERGRDNIDIVAAGMFDKRWFVVRNTVTILARIDSDRILHFLERAVNHEEKRVRLELVCSLGESRLERFLPLLKTCLFDSDRDVRHKSVEIILSYKNKAAYQAISQAINDQNFTLMEPSEQLSLIRAFSRLGGEQALPLLRKLAMMWNPLMKSRVRLMRSCALVGLQVNPSIEADKILRDMSRSWRLDLRQQARQALDERCLSEGNQP